MSLILLDAVDVDTIGVSNGITFRPSVIAVYATSFGGGTVTFQVSPDGGTTWLTPTYGGLPTTYTSNTVVRLPSIGNGMYIRATLSGSSGANDVSVVVFDDF